MDGPRSQPAVNPPSPSPDDEGLPHGPDEGAPISRIVAEVAARFPGERISLGEMAEAFGDRAFGLLILLLCIPALIPGMASVFAVPMLVLGVQMGLGYEVPRLPGFLARRGLKRVELLRFASTSSRWLKKVERYVRPRPSWTTGPVGHRLTGWLTVVVAIMLILPGPGTNGPPAFGAIVMSLGLVEHDGRVTGIGMAITALGCLFAAVMILLILWFGTQAFHWLF